MKTWLADTLARRLLLLMWAALVGSHLIAFAVFQLVHAPPLPAAAHPKPALPTFPSLPPTPGVPQAAVAGGPSGPGGPGGQGGPGGPPSLPWDGLLLDYGVRFIVIAAAAWLGSRWLAAPMRRLARASRTLGDSLTGARQADTTLDEHSGTVEVREVAQVFNGMAQQLREQFQSRGLMVAAISHDLRTPLTRLRMRLETMQADPEQQARGVADIREMNALIDRSLEVFRLDGPASQEPLQPTDVDALVQALADDLSEQGQPVQVEGEADRAACVAPAQPMALRRVLENLVTNALRYGELARVRVRAEAGVVLIEVEDQGPGIPEHELEAVFQPFYRLEASRNRHTGGTGLGLYIARDLSRRQGGRLVLNNRAEGGLRATLSLPRH